MKSSKIIYVVVITLLLLPPLTGCRKGVTQEGGGGLEKQDIAARDNLPLRQFAKTRMQMGTFVSITVFGREKSAAERAIDLAFNRIDEIEDLMSTFKEDSELSIANRKASTESIPLTQDTFIVLKKAVEFSRLSDGAFDITYKPLSKLWTAAEKNGRLPTEDELEKALGMVGYEKISLDAEEQAVTFLQKGLELDVGGIAKGYAVDEAVEVLRAHGIESAIVEAGGDLYAMGAKPGGKPWLVGIQDPFNDENKETFFGKLKVKDCAVATSGDYQRFSVIEGEKYSHIINPLTGWPVKNVPSVTVIASDAITADTLSTTLSVMEVEEGMEFVQSMHDVAALIMFQSSNNQMQYARTPNFAAFEY